jgi:hypothetical protein
MYSTKKNCFNFLIILSLMIIFLYYYYQDDEKKDTTIISNIDNIKIENKEDNYKIHYINTPELRGVTNKYQLNLRIEEGGSKVFSNNYNLDDSNLKNNEINYTNPSTYTKLPTTLADLKK